GLEMAEALAKRGLKVHVVEKLPHVMAVMDPEISGFVEEELAAHGVELHKNLGVARIGDDSVTLEDGSTIEAQLVLLSIGVRPTLQLAKDAGLELGPAGGLLVDSTLRTSDPDILAAGDMVEIEHRVHKAKVRIPLAGPANRQGRIAAENALGAEHAYKGALGTSIVRVFDAVAGTTGLSLKAARAAGIDAQSVTVHKEHHTAYYPGAKQVTVRLVYDKSTGRILGGQTAGYAGADRRLDVVAMAAASGMTVHDLADVDFAYSPPLGTANDAMNMAAFVAENRLSGHGPSLSVEELDAWVEANDPVVVDVRDGFAFEKSHVEGAVNLPLDTLADQASEIPPGRAVLVYDETGKKGHQAVRLLIGSRGGQILNITGGHQSLQRHARAVGFSKLEVQLLPVAAKSLEGQPTSAPQAAAAPVPEPVKVAGPLIVDVRTPGEFATGAYPGAVNIPLDELPDRLSELGRHDREIILYCASGGRSGYATRMLAQSGFTNLTNAGGLSQMMRRGR
ncbi:MAG TPA: FAD-dependent oxidoreductase, partial [Fibrobacteria bacterium]|nr:FAD-dependent oxidoreductase [Fibrobacteria bacterium]